MELTFGQYQVESDRGIYRFPAGIAYCTDDKRFFVKDSYSHPVLMNQDTPDQEISIPNADYLPIEFVPYILKNFDQKNSVHMIDGGKFDCFLIAEKLENNINQF